jgi:hypothetical protein
MYKALCMAALLAGLLALTGRSSSAAPAPFTSPIIVAKGKLVNQTAPIPTTTIFTPAQSGLFRLSVYGTITNGTGTDLTQWNYNPMWTDDSGIPLNAAGMLTSINTHNGSFQWTNIGQMGAAITLEAKGGTPITYSVTQSGPLDTSAYSLYYTLERLE